jgi:hypothetical protein
MTGSIGPMRNLGCNNRLWNDVPCDVDELARVIEHVDEIDAGGSPSSPCPDKWEYAPTNRINLAETLPLRFRVMVNPLKRVAFVAFRCTDKRQGADLLLDAHIIRKSWTTEQITKAYEAVAKIPSHCITDSFLMSALNDLRRVADLADIPELFAPSWSPFESVRSANAYIEATVKPWAEEKSYTLVVGGYSLGGFISQYVGYHQNLYNVSFDGLWGATGFLPRPLNLNIANKCATVVYRRDSVISWPEIGMGYRYQIIPPGRDRESQIISNGGLMGRLGHSMSFFYDVNRTLSYMPSQEDISTIYGIPLDSHTDISDFLKLTWSVDFFRRNINNPPFPLVSNGQKNAVYEQMYFIIRDRLDFWKAGEFYFLFSATPQEKIQAIEPVLTSRWRQARGL